MGVGSSKICNVVSIKNAQEVINSMLLDYEFTENGGRIKSSLKDVKGVTIPPYDFSVNSPPPQISKYDSTNIKNKIQLDTSVDETGDIKKLIDNALVQHTNVINNWGFVGQPDTSGIYNSADKNVIRKRGESFMFAKGSLLKLYTKLKKECKSEEKENVKARTTTKFSLQNTVGGGKKKQKGSSQKGYGKKKKMNLAELQKLAKKQGTPIKNKVTGKPLKKNTLASRVRI